MSYDKLVAALRCKGLSKKCDSCGYGYHLSPDSECNDACHFEQIVEDAAAAIEALQAELEKKRTADCWGCKCEKMEPKRGEWKEWDGDTTWYCSVCGEPWTLIDGTPKENNMNYCPNCGADMRKMEARNERTKTVSV